MSIFAPIFGINSKILLSCRSSRIIEIIWCCICWGTRGSVFVIEWALMLTEKLRWCNFVKHLVQLCIMAHFPPQIRLHLRARLRRECDVTQEDLPSAQKTLWVSLRSVVRSKYTARSWTIRHWMAKIVHLNIYSRFQNLFSIVAKSIVIGVK